MHYDTIPFDVYLSYCFALKYAKVVSRWSYSALGFVGLTGVECTATSGSVIFHKESRFCFINKRITQAVVERYVNCISRTVVVQ